MAAGSDLKEHVVSALESLPEEAIREVAALIDRLQQGRGGAQTSPYRPVALGGLWKGVHLTDEDIADVRREMWGRFTEQDP